MRKSIRMSAKPLAMATAFAAGTTISMIATALPGGDTLGATGVVNESICQQSVNMTIAGGARSVTTGTGTCQLRTLPPTKGFVRTESSPAGSTVADSGAMVNAGGELYEAYVAGERDAAVLLTPNRSLATSRAVSFTSGNGGGASFDLAASVQPSAGLQSNWLTGTYHIVNRNHNFSIVAANLENSVYANPNPALGERNYTKSMDVTFNGNGTCSINDMNSHSSFQLTKDPLMNAYGEMDVTCFDAPCGQNSGNDYLAVGNVNMGMTSSLPSTEDDWEDTADGNGNGVEAVSCAYTVPSAGKIDVTYTVRYGSLADVPSMTTKAWTVGYNVSSDLRYIVSDGDSATDSIDSQAMKGGLAVGVRVGSPTLTGKTYLFNALDSNYATSTPTTGSYENPQTPVYQEEECLTRGSLVLSSGGACTVDTVSTCTGRNHGGLEETAADAADGTITDAITAFDGAPAATPTCSWSGTPSDLQISLGVLDQDGNPVTMQYTGAAADNGEALVLQGIYNIGGPVPDTDNAPLLPQEKFNMLSFLVAQEYQGSLVADADADGLNNLGEFQWAKDNTQAKSSANDFNGDGIADVMMLDSNGNWAYVFPFANGQSSGYAFSQLFPDQLWEIKSTEDYDADGTTDVLMRRSDLGIWFIFKMGGAQGTAQSYDNFGLFGGAYEIVGTGDFDNSGNRSIIMENPNTQEYWRFTVQNGAVTSQAALGLFGGTWAIKSVADFDGDGDDDVLMGDSVSGSYYLFTMDAGNVSGYSAFGLYGGTWVVRATADFNGDGQKDILMRNSADGDWRVFVVGAGAVTSVVNPGMFPATGWDFSFASDTNGDGTTDVVYQNVSNGLWFVGLMDNTATATNQVFNLWDSASWLLSSVGDYTGDGIEDVILKNTANGAFYTFPISGGQVQPFLYSQLFLIPAPTDRKSVV